MSGIDERETPREVDGSTGEPPDGDHHRPPLPPPATGTTRVAGRPRARPTSSPRTDVAASGAGAGASSADGTRGTPSIA